MDARLSPEQELLREAAREFLQRECPSSFVRQWMEDPKASPAPLWKALSELGWTGLLVRRSMEATAWGWWRWPSCWRRPAASSCRIR